jgi:hypothetical protein
MMKISVEAQVSDNVSCYSKEEVYQRGVDWDGSVRQTPLPISVILRLKSRAELNQMHQQRAMNEGFYGHVLRLREVGNPPGLAPQPVAPQPAGMLPPTWHDAPGEESADNMGPLPPKRALPPQQLSGPLQQVLLTVLPNQSPDFTLLATKHLEKIPEFGAKMEALLTETPDELGTALEALDLTTDYIAVLSRQEMMLSALREHLVERVKNVRQRMVQADVNGPADDGVDLNAINNDASRM